MGTGIDFSEILLILVLILVFFGSKELPRFIRQSARVIGKLRGYSDKVRRELDEMTRSLDATASAPGITPTAFDQKNELRKKYSAARGGLAPEQRREKSAAILAALMQSPLYVKADAVMMYASVGAEVETGDAVREMLRSGRRVVMPFCMRDQATLGIAEIKDPDNDLVAGENSVPEPRPEIKNNFFRSDLRLIVCPGVGFDLHGGRLGRGKAYYDNFLREVKGRIPIVGLAFDCQIQEERLPFSYSDVPVDQIITESGVRFPRPEPTGGGGPAEGSAA